MDKYLNNKEEQLFDLIDQKDFDQLTSTEQNLVLAQISEEDYRFRRSLVMSAASTYDDAHIVPAPLLLSTEQAIPFWRKPIPLYQATLVAAAIAVMWMVFPFNHNQSEQLIQTEYLVQTDTVEVEKWQIDTIVKTIEKPIYIEKEVLVENTQTTNKEEPRLLLPGPSTPVYINEDDIASKGSSLNGEKSSTVLPAIASEKIGFRP